MEEDSSGHTQPSFAPPPRRRAMRTARADRGEMPPEIESVFESARVSLFPSRASELATACSCPDWSNPCKHVAAVYYLLGEEFDRDPFLLFTLRGLTRAEQLAQLAGTAPSSRRAKRREHTPEAASQAEGQTASARLQPRRAQSARKTRDPRPDAPRLNALDASKFWKEAAPPDALTSDATAPPVHAEPV